VKHGNHVYLCVCAVCRDGTRDGTGAGGGGSEGLRQASIYLLVFQGAQASGRAAAGAGYREAVEA